MFDVKKSMVGVIDNSKISVSDIFAVGSPYVDHDVSVEGMGSVEYLGRLVGECLHAIGKWFQYKGEMLEEGTEYLVAIRKLSDSRHLNLSIQKNIEELCEGLMEVFKRRVFEEEIPDEKLALRPESSTFAFVDGKIYYTPICLVYGDLHSSVEQLVDAVLKEVQNTISEMVSTLKEKAGVTEEAASDALRVLTGITDDPTVGKPQVLGLAVGNVECSPLYFKEYNVTKDRDVVVAITLREYKGKREMEEITEEEFTTLNAVEFTEIATRRVFDNLQRSFIKKYGVLNEALVSVIKYNAEGGDIRPPRPPRV